MTLKEIATKHGLPVTVKTNEQGYPSFALLKELPDGSFKYKSNITGEIHRTYKPRPKGKKLSDYVVVRD